MTTTENLTHAAAHDLAAMIHRYGRETVEAAWRLVEDEPVQFGTLAELMADSAKEPTCNQGDDDDRQL